MNGYRDRLGSFRCSWMDIGIVRCLSEVPEWPEGYAGVFQRRGLGSYRDSQMSFRGA